MAKKVSGKNAIVTRAMELIWRVSLLVGQQTLEGDVHNIGYR